MKNTKKALMHVVALVLVLGSMNTQAQTTTKDSVLVSKDSVATPLVIKEKLTEVKSSSTSSKMPTVTFNNGIGIVAPDSLFSLNFRFRTQLRAGYNSVSGEDFSASVIEARVRRMRLRFEGFLLNPKFSYFVQLSFSRGDMDWVDNEDSKYNSSPNVVRDAMVTYRPNSKLSFTFGQTKLPGNRQRVNSSGELQFVDRSIVNAQFNIDRDFGLQFAYQSDIAGLDYVLKGAVTSGEGRNSVASDGGLAYTGRLEVLPLGKFTNRGDYFEGDLEREKTPKVSLAAGYNHNDGAVRAGGTLGRDLYEKRNLGTFFADFLLKYRGMSLCSEYMNRNASDPITTGLDSKGKTAQRIIFVGHGVMTQLSYLFKNNIEIAGRYALIHPFDNIAPRENLKEEIGVGATKYLRKHRVKIQANVYYNKAEDMTGSIDPLTNWSGIFQLELGI